MSDSNRQSILKAELTNDPLARGYAGMSDQAAADDLNTEYRTVDRDTVTGDDILQQIVWEEYYADSGVAQGRRCDDMQRAALNAFFKMDQISIKIPAVRQMVNRAVTNTSTSRTNLQALQQETISRARELGVPDVRLGEVERARA